jgi:hypothetical protein
VRALRDPEKGKWAERWQRRGELLTVAGFTAAITTASTGEWVGAIFAAVATILGVWAIVASETDWLWLPGRKREEVASTRRLVESTGDEVDRIDLHANLRQIATALSQIAAAVETLSREPPKDV